MKCANIYVISCLVFLTIFSVTKQKRKKQREGEKIYAYLNLWWQKTHVLNLQFVDLFLFFINFFR